jgi:hypothetical protein
MDALGDLYVADTGNNRVRTLWAYGPELELSDFSMGQAGTYELVLSNAFGSTNTAVIAVRAVLPALSASLTGGTLMHLQFAGPPGSNYVLETATNLASPANWRPLATNAAGTNGIGTFTDTNTLSSRARFYRLGLP